jgi:hypothetical protein
MDDTPCIVVFGASGHDQDMMRGLRDRIWLTALAAVLAAGTAGWAQAPPEAAADFAKYVGAVETRRAAQLRPEASLLGAVDRERAGEVVIEKQIPEKDADPPGAMLHDWRGMAFAPGARAADFERVMRNFPAYPKLYAPQVLRSAVASRDGDRYAVTIRVKQKHVITVVMDAAYDVAFGRLGDRRGWSTSRSTSVKEIAAAGTDKERALGPKEEHGFLWRLNTYWTYEERDGGLYLQIESVSLTRAIPAGLGWAVRPFVESVPRESLEFTLRKTCEALRKESRK